MVPFDDQSPFVTSGIRIGTTAITTRGVQEEHIFQIVNWIDEIITNHEDDGLIEGIKKKVNETMKEFPLFNHH